MDSSIPQYTNTTAFERLGQTDKAVDWSREAVREAREESIVISADFMAMTLTNTLFVRATVPQATLHIGSYWEDDSSVYGPYDIEGAEADQEFYVDNSSMFLRLTLPDSAAPVHRVSYKYRITASESLKESAITSLLSWPLRLYTVNLTFEGEIPENITWTLTSVTGDDTSEGKTVLTRTLTPVGNTVTIARDNVSRGESVLAWS